MRITGCIALLALGALFAGCVGGSDTNTAPATVAPIANEMALTVDAGPPAAGGQINHAYVTVKVCAPGSQTCASIDHILLDTGSNGLRLVGSVIAAHSLSLPGESDSQGQALEECVTFGGGETWGPVATADVLLAGEAAHKVPMQVMDDSNTSAPPPAGCGVNGTLLNGVSGFGANGVLGLGVFAQDCGQDCVAASTPLPIYYGCTAEGVCAAENVPLTQQVANVVAQFSADNNGFIVSLPALVNANGDASAQGQLIFGLSTQADNMLPATGLTVLGADASGDFQATYNGATKALPALIDSGTDAFAFDDPTIIVCTSDAFVGYYCPAIAPQAAFAVNSGLGRYTSSNTVNFAIADPNTFVAGAAAFTGLAGGGGSISFTWGMPFFYGRPVYFGIDQRVSDTYLGPFYAY